VENLRSAGVRFVQAADAYLRQRTASGPVAPTALDAVQERRLELAAALGQVAAAHPDWTDLPELRRRLAAEMGGDFVGVAGQLSADTARQWAARVAALADEAERVAAAHEAGARRPGPASTTKTQVTSGGGA
jgi:hypothetical protein